MRAKYNLVQVKEESGQYFKTRKNEKTHSRGLENNKEPDQLIQHQPPCSNQVSNAQYIKNEKKRKKNGVILKIVVTPMTKPRQKEPRFQYARLVERCTPENAEKESCHSSTMVNLITLYHILSEAEL